MLLVDENEKDDSLTRRGYVRLNEVGFFLFLKFLFFARAYRNHASVSFKYPDAYVNIWTTRIKTTRIVLNGKSGDDLYSSGY